MNRDALLELLYMLSNTPGTSGDEIEVRRALRPHLEGHVESLRVDAMGNLIAHKKGTGAHDLRVLLTAHMDEVGLMVVDHTGEGALKVATSGSIDARLLPGLEVRVGPQARPGVIGIKAIHRADEDENVIPVSALTVDIGAHDREEALELAPIGTRITFATTAHPLGQLVAGKAFDDRAGCAALVALLQGPPLPCDVFGVFTVQEEVGLRGARVAGYTVAPAAAFVLEGTIADDLPKEEEGSPTSEIGKGPVLTVMDRSYVADPRLVRLVIQVATAAGIPYQFKQPGIGGTDAGTIHFTREGVPAITLAIPCRYIHGPVALLDPQDLEYTVALLRASLEQLTPEVIQRS
ncbi:MAG TPA: M20/M25/M40 family metallo-hydrolase [Anaerolineae bacterium]|nr:M20/M25/M40 family metallo-hydrolase [Anaerolineae bacterium]